MPGVTRPIEILLAEDSPTDRLMAVEALEHARVLNSLNVVENGEDALAYLRRKGKYSEVRRPDLILLDLNMPKVDGREVLREIKSDPLLKFIPVVILTTSKAEEDIIRAYGYHANSYITKPVDFDRFSEIVRSIENYWFCVVTLPPDLGNRAESLQTALQRRPAGFDMDKRVAVLVAEDNETDLLLIKDALRDSTLVKFSITAVSTLAEARVKLTAGGFDVVLTDINLPDSVGMDTYRQLRMASSGLPIIVLTGQDDESLGITALREGAQDYLIKGQLDERALARALRYAIEKRNIEERLRQSQKMEAIGRLSAGVAHDFNNILTIIQGQASLALNDQAADIPAALHEIKGAADRASNLTRQLLTFSRQQVIQTVPLDLNTVVGNVSSMLRRILGEDIQLEQHLQSAELRVEADVGMLEQVVMNLAVNARDAMPEGGKLSVETKLVVVSPKEKRTDANAYPGKFACLTLKDTGFGIPAAKLPHIFEPFFTTKDVGKGTGLGLSTVYGIVEQHRGWIEVRSEVKRGTAFEIFLPITDRPIEAKDGEPEAEKPVIRGHETILLVEDEAGVRQLVKMVLEHEGYKILEAATGVEALKLWPDHKDDIVMLFTDYVMPDGVSGKQLAERMFADKPDLKALFSSGYSADISNGNFKLQEGVNFISKPFEVKQLLTTVRRCLDAGPSGSPFASD